MNAIWNDNAIFDVRDRLQYANIELIRYHFTDCNKFETSNKRMELRPDLLGTNDIVSFNISI